MFIESKVEIQDGTYEEMGIIVDLETAPILLNTEAIESCYASYNKEKKRGISVTLFSGENFFLIDTWEDFKELLLAYSKNK